MKSKLTFDLMEPLLHDLENEKPRIRTRYMAVDTTNTDTIIIIIINIQVVRVFRDVMIDCVTECARVGSHVPIDSIQPTRNHIIKPETRNNERTSENEKQ